jgi:ABC-type polysaccharide/polyol phosphate transport system ATPase subunit
MIALDLQNIRKIYRIYEYPAQRLKEIILRRPFHTDFTALENINFTVYEGGTFGIIGENGAGKSTLLKILAKTLKPTSGNVLINGRSAALLELGAGFNPELTGEENIYLNAYLLGLSKTEIDDKKDEIIAFSELGDFIKRPVKTYSSGMHVRLAFSIATSVNPDILIIDEALSVGDEYFQKKCIDRMMSFKKNGKTILFCSHSMYHIQELCDRAVWLHQGRTMLIGNTGKVIMEYQNYERGKGGALKEKVSDILDNAKNTGEKALFISEVKIKDGNNHETEAFKTFDPVTISFKIRCVKENIKGHIGFAIIRNDEIMSFGTFTKFDGLAPFVLRDSQEFTIALKSLQVLSGLYSILVVVADEFAMHPYDHLRTKTFSVVNPGRELGMNYMEHMWEIDGQSLSE